MSSRRTYWSWGVRALALVAGCSVFSLSDQHVPALTQARAAVADGTAGQTLLAPATGRHLAATTEPRGAAAAAAQRLVPEPPAAVADTDIAPGAQIGDSEHALAVDAPLEAEVVPAAGDALGAAVPLPQDEPAPEEAPEAAAGEDPASAGDAAVAERPFSQPQLLPHVLRAGQSSEQVRELQVRLRHAKVLATYDADGVFGPQTAAAVQAFQRRNELPRTGVVDQATWDQLLAQSHDPTDAEMSNTDIGPWFVNPQQHVWMMELQDRLRQVGVYRERIDGTFDAATRDAIARYRERLGLPASEVVDERVWAQLLRVTHNPSYASLFDAPPASTAEQQLDERCLSGKVVCISKAQKKLSYVVDGDVKFTRPARFSLPQYESPEGEFRVWYKNRDQISRKFGERFPMPYAIFYDGNVAVHFSDDFADNGYDGGSHGCSQLDDYQAAKWLYEQVAVGDRVVVY